MKPVYVSIVGKRAKIEYGKKNISIPLIKLWKILNSDKLKGQVTKQMLEVL